jgi:peptidoglycan biosynthesis protein MviN/MurJ (putative lipid II flippase)
VKIEVRAAVQVLQVTFWKGIGLLISLATVILFANQFGASASTDAYFLARRLALGAASSFERAFQLLYVPGLVARRQAAGRAGLDRSTRHHILWTVALATGLSGLAFVFAGPIVGAMAPGFDAEQTAQAVLFLRILLVGLPLAAFAGIAGAALNALKIFSLPVVARLMPRVFVLVALIVVPAALGFAPISVAVTVGSVVMALLMLGAYRKASRRVADAGNGQGDASSILLGRRAAAMAAAQAYLMGATWVDMAIASLAGVGAIAALEFGLRLINVAPSAVSSSVTTVYYTDFAESAHLRDVEALRGQVGSAARITLFFIVPMAAVLFLLADVIVSVLLAHGAFGAEAARDTTQVVRALAPLLLVNALLSTMIAATFADAALPQFRIIAVGCLAALFVRIGFDLAMIERLGVVAVPIGSLLAATAMLVVNGWWLGRQWGPVVDGPLLRTIARTLICAAAAGLVMFVARGELFPGLIDSGRVTQVLALIALGAVAAIVYVGVAIALGVEELRVFLSVFSRARLRGRAEPDAAT